MGTLPDFRTFPPDDLLGLFICQRGYLQGYKTSKIASVAICGRSCHIMPVLLCSSPDFLMLTPMMGRSSFSVMKPSSTWVSSSLVSQLHTRSAESQESVTPHAHMAFVASWRQKQDLLGAATVTRPRIPHSAHRPQHVLLFVLAGHPRSGCPARLRGHKGSGLWKVWTVPSPPLPSPPPSSPPSLPPACQI